MDRTKKTSLIICGLVVVFGFFFLATRRPHIPTSDFSTEQKFLTRLFAKEQPEKAYGYFTKTYAQLDASIAHDLAHVVGTTLYKTQGKSGIVFCDDSFEWGCFHGFLSQAIAAAKDPPKDICDTVAEGDKASCFHGIGHGLLIVFGYAISGLERSLVYCESLPGQFSTCAAGVFMEYNTQRSSQLMKGTRDAQTVRVEAVYEPCILLSLKYQAECFLDQPPRWFSYLSDDPKEIAMFCAKVSNPENRIACYRGIARITPIGFSKEDMFSEFCQVIPSAFGRRACAHELGIIEDE